MEIDSKSWLAFLTPIWLCRPYSLITLWLTKARRARPRPGWVTDTHQLKGDQTTFTTWRWWLKWRDSEVQENSHLAATYRWEKGDKEQLWSWQEWGFNKSLLWFFSPELFAGCAADFHCGELCLCVCSLCGSICPSICLSPRSITCVSCGSLLCLLKAELGSQNPLDWCSVVSVLYRNHHLVLGQRKWVRGSSWGVRVTGTVLVLHLHLCGFSPFSKRYAVWSLTFQNNQIYLSSGFVSLPGRRHQFDPTEWPFPVVLIFPKHTRKKRDTITDCRIIRVL